MKYIYWLALAFMLIACQAPPSLPTIDIIDGETHSVQTTTARVPAEIFAESGIPFGPLDKLYVNGAETEANAALDCDICTLQIRRAVTLTLVTPDGEQELVSSAWTVGEALVEFGIQLHTADALNPPAGTALTDQMTVNYTPARQLAVRVDGQVIPIRSSAATVGDALLGAGIPLVGLDTSQPSPSEALPADGQIRIIHITEAIELAQTSIPFETEYVASNELAVEDKEILEAGVPGLIVQQTRVRYENGEEVSREVEAERTVREPSTQTVAYGTQYVLKSAIVDGQEIAYWRALEVYATSYSPCRSAADRCYPNTASGLPVTQGVIAVTRDWYLALRGQPVYVPGYGYATVEDVGGGIAGRNWIDLGYSDGNYQAWHNWVTLYFLPPVPANTVWVLE
jgi:uncharacterized protein YabE (DUF348 family)